MTKTLTKLFFLLLFLAYAPAVLAQDLTVTCYGGGSCTKSGADPLFAASEALYPGMSLAKTIRFVNKSSSSQNIGLSASGAVQDPSACQLDGKLGLEIRQVNSSPPAKLVYTDSLKNFYTAGELTLASFAPEALEDFTFTVYMDSALGNECQEKETKFNLTLGFLGTNSSDGGGGGGVTTTTSTDTGSVLGAGVEPVGSVLGTAATKKTGHINGGLQTERKKSPGRILGVETAKACEECRWQEILLGLAVALFVYYRYLVKKAAPIRAITGAVLIGIAFYAAFLWLNRDCPVGPWGEGMTPVLCRYFWLLDLILVLGISWLWHLRRRMA